jgi:hypothetical protein
MSFTIIDTDFSKPTVNSSTFRAAGFSENSENSKPKESASPSPTISEHKEKWNSLNLSSASIVPILNFWTKIPMKLREPKANTKTYCIKTFFTLFSTEHEQ